MMGRFEKSEAVSFVTRSKACPPVAVRGRQDLLGNRLSRVLLRNSGENFLQSLRTELFLSRILGFQDAIRSEKNDVARLQVDGRLIILGIGNEAERHAFQADGLHLTFADQEGIR